MCRDAFFCSQTRSSLSHCTTHSIADTLMSHNMTYKYVRTCLIFYINSQWKQGESNPLYFLNSPMRYHSTTERRKATVFCCIFTDKQIYKLLIRHNYIVLSKVCKVCIPYIGGKKNTSNGSANKIMRAGRHQQTQIYTHDGYPRKYTQY